MKATLQTPVTGQKPVVIPKKESELRVILEKVMPFLFKKQAKQSAVRTVVKSAPRKMAVTHKKTKKRTQRKAVKTITVRKQVKHPASTSAKIPVTELPKEDSLTVTAATDLKHTSPVASKKTGFIVAPTDKKNADASPDELLAEAKDDAFLSKVAGVNAIDKNTQKTNGWSVFKRRFFGPTSTPKVATAEKTLNPKDVMDPKEIAQDSFLQRVHQKNVNDVVGTSVDADTMTDEELAQAKEGGESALDDFASGERTKRTAEKTKGRILSAADLRKETKEAKEAALRVEKEVKEIKEEMRATQKEREKEIDAMEKKPEPKKAEPLPEPVQKAKKPVHAHKNGLQHFLASIGHIGLGKERMRFVQNLATMLNAGLPLIDSLKTLQLETRAKPMRKLLQNILDAVENGSPLWRAMEAQSFFSLHALALVRIGEEAGNLAQNMEYLANQEEKDHALKSKVKMAMIYPSIVLTIMFIIVIGLGMFVLPNLISVLYSLNVPLPLVTRLVIMFTNGFTTYGTIAVPASIAGFILTIIIAKYTPLKAAFQWAMFKIPGIGRLAREATIARFGVILGGLLKAGVPVIEAMQSLVEVTPIVSYRKLYARMLDHISIGDSFSKSFSGIKGSEKLLPPSVQQLVITGEKSGALADIMLKIADIYDKKASETAQKLPVILEPMLLLFIGGLVGTIAFAIIVPIYSIVGNVGR